MGCDFLKVAVNLSGYQFRQSDLFHKLTQILFHSGLDPKYLELELTEKILLDNIKSNVQRLKLIKNLGIQIALDDFGTGYSSLEYLQQFPFDILKIDRGFIKKIDENGTNSVITQTIIQMAHRLGLKVVAEGVETKQQLKFLQQNQCDEVQGFLFSRPLSTKEFEQLIRSKKSLQEMLVVN
jgi:EAL domain-containing protein (putative c-di-GMP-specific phosphodiesterase class I)